MSHSPKEILCNSGLETKVRLNLEHWGAINVAISGYLSLFNAKSWKEKLTALENLKANLNKASIEYLPVHLDQASETITYAIAEEVKEMRARIKKMDQL